AFHQSLPPVAACYALPRELSERLELRRYGFHGTSYQYASQRLLECLGRKASGSKLIICHLGNGASVCALQDGKSVDTSMGFTPLEGLIMGTRCGDIDAGLLLYLLRTQEITPAQLDTLLNQQSGLKGLAGQGGDVRLLERAAADGDPQAELALAAFAYRVRKYIGAYAAALGGVDALAFTGGIGEHSAAMRTRICEGLAFLGITLNPVRNAAAQATETLLSPDNSPTPVWKIPTDEQRQLAREAFALLKGKTP
ncbi:acetate/propionate family kinase, partial [Armatimonas sp.]|uniref:acetate/propionate family kinase n=1 Tax=Armatimonas sp. TaxID=1872638 RepID=UPI003751A9EB